MMLAHRLRLLTILAVTTRRPAGRRTLGPDPATRTSGRQTPRRARSRHALGAAGHLRLGCDCFRSLPSPPFVVSCPPATTPPPARCAPVRRAPWLTAPGRRRKLLIAKGAGVAELADALA